MQSSTLPAQVETDFDITSIFSIMLPIMTMVMMMKEMGSAMGGSTKLAETA